MPHPTVGADVIAAMFQRSSETSPPPESPARRAAKQHFNIKPKLGIGLESARAPSNLHSPVACILQWAVLALRPKRRVSTHLRWQLDTEAVRYPNRAPKEKRSGGGAVAICIFFNLRLCKSKLLVPCGLKETGQISFVQVLSKTPHLRIVDRNVTRAKFC
jgi:hypothetical protein